MASASRIKASWIGRSSAGKVSGGLGSGFAGCSLPSMFAGASIFEVPVSSLRVFLFIRGAREGGLGECRVFAK